MKITIGILGSNEDGEHSPPEDFSMRSDGTLRWLVCRRTVCARTSSSRSALEGGNPIEESLVGPHRKTSHLLNA